jgi:hypothetical protein
MKTILAVALLVASFAASATGVNCIDGTGKFSFHAAVAQTGETTIIVVNGQQFVFYPVENALIADIGDGLKARLAHAAILGIEIWQISIGSPQVVQYKTFLDVIKRPPKVQYSCYPSTAQ